MDQIEISYVDLAETRGQLLNEVRTLSFEELNRKPDLNQWSAAEVCHHLYLTEKSFTKGIIYGLKKANTEKAAPKPIQLLKDRSKKIDAPDLVKPSQEPLDFQQIVNLLNESRTSLLDVLKAIEDRTALKTKSAKHLLFGDLPLYQWIEIVYLHEQRHIEQIKQIKAQIL
ncbi:DinB family protein [Neobacillus endophyticus]|uniref:DinB family protein n=1 Tax=Neobacillus endophyticus TaxID=2738405 RepID=UPI001C26D180|nr:DinB family protein [Neobacillus endophyticus]